MFWSSSTPQNNSNDYSTNKNDDLNGGCPVKSRVYDNQCPVKHSSQSELNQMPILEQTPSEGQEVKLEIDRQVSSIPRASSSSSNGNDNRWVYPSQQQFYNALKRKNYETDARDIESILHIHNEMNEQSWQEIKKWESMHKECECEPRLVRFMGRPGDLTPKARFLNMIGMAPLPFDRHDWIVDRCGKEVRYVIDYYHGPSLPGTAVLHVDARPALDDFSSIVDRLKMFLPFTTE